MEDELIKISTALELLKSPHSRCCAMTLIVPPGAWEVEIARLPGMEGKDGRLTADFTWKAENNYGFGLLDHGEYHSPEAAWNMAIERISAFLLETMTLPTAPRLVINEETQNAA